MHIMDSFRNILAKRLAQHHLSSEASASCVLDISKKEASKIWGDTWEKGFRFKKVVHKKIVCETFHSTWAQELFLHKTSLLENIKKTSEGSDIQDILIQQISFNNDEYEDTQ